MQVNTWLLLSRKSKRINTNRNASYRLSVTSGDQCSWGLSVSCSELRLGKRKVRRAPRKNQPLFALPQTIEDVITVTLDLQFQYLWVDMYCIKQNDMLDFHTQIQQMDRIYRGAEITIIAAAGTGPSGYQFGEGVQTSLCHNWWSECGHFIRTTVGWSEEFPMALSRMDLSGKSLRWTQTLLHRNASHCRLYARVGQWKYCSSA